MNYYSPKLLSKNIILIDGINRTGKLLTGSLVSSLKNSEHLEYGENFEHFCPALEFNKVNIHFARSFISNYLNELIYNKYLSRNVNFRPSDRTGVPNSISYKIYKKRLKSPEGDGAIKLIKKEQKQIPFVTHNLLVNVNSLNKLNINYKMIALFRNPLDLTMSWFKKGIGIRLEKKTRIFTLLMNKKDKIYHWYDLIKKNSLSPKNELEKCIDYVCTLTEKSVKNYKKLNNYEKEKILISSYEDIIQNTNVEIENIAKFLNLKTTIFTKKFIKKENCPTIIATDKLNQRRLYIKSKVSNKYYEKLINLEEKFKNKIYGLSK